jgi:WD40 repeat protein
LWRRPFFGPCSGPFITCTPDGATLASSSRDKTVRLWCLADNTCTAVLEGHTNDVNTLVCTPDGATLASGSDDNTVRLWRLADNTTVGDRDHFAFLSKASFTQFHFRSIRLITFASLPLPSGD